MDSFHFITIGLLVALAPVFDSINVGSAAPAALIMQYQPETSYLVNDAHDIHEETTIGDSQDEEGT